jgi:hypothetical protein
MNNKQKEGKEEKEQEKRSRCITLHRVTESKPVCPYRNNGKKYQFHVSENSIRRQGISKRYPLTFISFFTAPKGDLMLKFRIFPTLILFLSLLFSISVHSEELKEWPREVKVSSGSITIYQPQVESLKGNILKGRTAIAYHGSGSDSPVFGAAWFTAQVNINRDNRTVRYQTLDITDTRFPKENKQLADELKQAVQEGVKKGNLTSSLDELTTALAAVEQEQKQAADLNNDPPEIIYMETPALLVVIDGKTMLQKIENSDYQAVANTPYPLFSETKSGKWFLNAAENVWYSAKKDDGPWSYTDQPPAVLVKMVASKASESELKTEPSETKITAENAPAIVVVHKPTELVVSTGKAEFTPLTDDLLAMSNTDSNVFMDVQSQQYYLIVAGRWYKAKSMTAAWHYVAADQLPATFAEIPATSEYADVRASIAGTDEAREAVMDAQIPQTAAVKKGTVDIQVVYDGKPDFKSIDGTDLQFAVNCSETVLKAGGQFYLVKDAVWYIASSATGPWDVSDHAPPGIGKIPPSSPVYNTKYVYVYDSTPEVVYVGYTPGYVGSYIYGPTIVYGTGYYYYPWITPYYYYPRPATWGFGVSYNPWTGWGFGISWSSGPFRVGFYTGGGYHGRYWGGRHYYGPRGYRSSYTNIHIDNVNINRNRNYNNISNRNNLYRNSGQRAHIQNTVNSRSISQADKQNIQNRMSANQGGRSGIGAAGGAALGAAGGAALGAAAVNSRNNNVLTDKNGNVLRNNNGQWQQRSNGQWQNRPATTNSSSGQQRSEFQQRNQGNKAAPATSQQNRSTAQQRSGYNRSSSADRQQYSRQRATSRTQSYSRPSGSSNRSSGGGRSRGGGGRRR